MTKLMMCSFCSNKGIVEPHNHTIRDFTKKGSPIMCPQLLRIQCNYCKEKGHTVKYCKILKEKKVNKKSPLAIINPKKHSLTVDNNGYIEVKKTQTIKEEHIHKIQKAPSFAHMLHIDLEAGCLTRFRTSSPVPKENELLYKFLNCGTMKPLYYENEDFDNK